MPLSGYTICTSEQLPPSTTVSHGFGVEWYSSPPFGSHGPCKHSKPCPRDYRPGDPLQCRCRAHPGWLLLSPCPREALASQTTLSKLHRLLGPCFKTGSGWRWHTPRGGAAKPFAAFCTGPRLEGQQSRVTTMEHGAVTTGRPDPGSSCAPRPGDWPVRRQARFCSSVLAATVLCLIKRSLCPFVTDLGPSQALCHLRIPRLHLRLGAEAQWPVREAGPRPLGAELQIRTSGRTPIPGAALRVERAHTTAPSTAIPAEASGTFNPLR